jgi:hypothetical protein
MPCAIFMRFIYGNFYKFFQQGPYSADSTASRPLCEVKQRLAWLVLRWGTTLESQVFLFLFYSAIVVAQQLSRVSHFFIFVPNPVSNPGLASITMGKTKRHIPLVSVARLLVTLLVSPNVHWTNAKDGEQHVQVQADGSIASTTASTKLLENADRANQGDICRDQHDLCKFWADADECLSNSDFMELGCPVSCDTCEIFMAARWNQKPANFATDSSIDPEYAEHLMEQSLDFGVRQTAVGIYAKGTLARIEMTTSYMQDGKTLSLPLTSWTIA